ncbi:hypothetical protein G6F31_017077 [Rhizopus arrhizus]|nr:hypothetical protein G6F31_017077 [Rhizopus arrhizus]
MLAHIGQCLLQDEQHLQLLLGRPRTALVPAEAQLGLDAGLSAEALLGGFNGGLQIALPQLAAEIGQQFAHVLVAFVHARSQQRQDLGDLFLVAALDCRVQHLQLQVQEVQALRQAVVQALGDQPALLHHRQLAGLRAEPPVIQRHAQVLPQANTIPALRRGSQCGTPPRWQSPRVGSSDPVRSANGGNPG